MELLLVRKNRLSLVVETLEDRRLLSQFGSTSGSVFSTHEIANHAEMAPPIQGSMIATGTNATPSSPGSTDRLASPQATPAASSNTPLANPRGNDCPTSTPSATPQGNADAPTGGTSPSPALEPASQPSARAANFGAESRGNAPGPGGDPSLGAFSVAPPANQPSRGASSAPPPVARSSGNVVQTSHVEDAGSARPEGPGHSPAAESPLAGIVTFPASSDIALGTSSHGPATLDIGIGQGWPTSQSRAAFDPGASKEVAETRSPDETPRSPIREKGIEVRVEVENLALTGPGEELDKPDPQLADMIMSLMPFDRSALEYAVDRFLEPLDGLTSSMPGLNGYVGLVSASLTLAVTVVTVDLAIRVRRSRKDEIEVDGDEGLVSFPGLPGVRRWARS